MKQSLIQEKLPIFVVAIERTETRFTSVDQIIEHLHRRIDEHPAARFIGIFDHLAHTQSLPARQVDPQVLAAKLIIFCFGITLSDPRRLATRPRSIGVAETPAGFVISFMEPPMPIANAAMESWVQDLCSEVV